MLQKICAQEYRTCTIVKSNVEMLTRISSESWPGNIEEQGIVKSKLNR
jgi:hypothetical protein